MVGTGAVTTLLLLTASPVFGQLLITDAIHGTFVDISGIGTPLALSDEGEAEVWPAFNLNLGLFSGGSGRVWISNNGALGFVDDGSYGAYYLNRPLPNPGLFGGAHDKPQALAVYWDDLDAETGEVYQATIGEAGSRVFIVQWQDRPHYPGDPTLDGNEATFQVQVFENADVVHAQMLYASVNFQNHHFDEGASATLGYQSGGIANDVQWSYDRPGAVTSGSVLTLLETSGDCEHTGDSDSNCHIDLGDFARLRGCLAGPGVPLAMGCACQDANRDGCVDLRDGAYFQASFTGPVETIPGCLP